MNRVDGWGQTYCTANGKVALDVFVSDPCDALMAYLESCAPTAAWRNTGGFGSELCAEPTRTAARPNTARTRRLMNSPTEDQEAAPDSVLPSDPAPDP